MNFFSASTESRCLLARASRTRLRTGELAFESRLASYPAALIAASTVNSASLPSNWPSCPGGCSFDCDWGCAGFCGCACFWGCAGSNAAERRTANARERTKPNLTKPHCNRLLARIRDLGVSRVAALDTYGVCQPSYRDRTPDA